MKKLKFLLAAIYLFVQIATFGQSNLELEKGDKAFDDFDFEEAIYFFSVAHENAPNDAEITRRIANTYRRMGQIPISAEWYRKTLEMDATQAEDMLHYAEALKNLEQYDEAIYWYEMYYKLMPGDSRAKSHLADKMYYKDLFADTARYNMKKLKINNANPTIGISLFEDEKILISAVNLEKGKLSEESPFLDVYICSLNDNNELTNPIRLDKKVNSKYHDGPVFYSFSEHKLYITRNNIRNGKPVRDKNGNVNLKIYSADYQNGTWSSAQELKINDDGYSTGHACLSKDGQTMYLVSTREGGYGGSDIYQCFKVGNTWSEPINLGENVNTPGNEMFPFIDEDGVLYFASDGHAGLGGLDVFFSMKKNDIWQHALNLGAPVNSAMDDFALVYDKESDNGYFCSNRSGKGDDDLYFYKHISIERMTVAGIIKANRTNTSLAGERIQIKKMKSGESTYQSLDQFERFEFSVEAGEKVEISMMNPEYFDPNAIAISYDIPQVILDPFINIGTKTVALKKIPPHEGKLSGINAQGLAQSKTDPAAESASNLSASENTDKNLNTLNAIGNSSNNSFEDLSELSMRNASLENENYKKKIELGDSMLKSKNYSEAKNAYLSASAILPMEFYPKEKIKEIDRLNEIATAEKKTSEYNSIVQKADKYYADGDMSNALKAYESATALMPEKEYPKTQVSKVKSAIARSKEEMLMSKTELAAKKASEFEKAEPVIDLSALEIDHVIFDFNKALVRKEDMPTLDKLVVMLKNNPETILMIRAHCDSRGSMAYNQSLSMSRAMAIQGYLIQKGIKRDRMKAEWFGEQRPLNGCVDNVPCSEGEFEVNRRAEFKIVSKN